MTLYRSVLVLHQQIIKFMQYIFCRHIFGILFLILRDAARLRCSVCKFFVMWCSVLTEPWPCGAVAVQ